MKKYYLSFFDLDSDFSFTQFAESLRATFINGMIRIPADTGSGIIKKMKLEEGVHLRLWDLKLNGPIVFEKIPNPATAINKTFYITYILNSELLIFKMKGARKKLKFPRGMNILFISDDAAFDFEIEALHGFQAIDISVTSTWLLNAFKDESPSFVSFIKELSEKANPTNLLESCTASEYRTLVDLYSSALLESKGLLHIRADVFSLLSDFFNKIFTHPANRVPDNNKIVDYEKIMEVEKILIAHIERTLPALDIIAHQVTMSESTLKRHFKLMFDKNIYEYYLEIKMNFAKRLLLETPLTVNEVATRLDYEKVNNFIDMFKRHHGISPGELRRKSA